MKNYELLTVFKPSLDAEELDKVVEKLTEDKREFSAPGLVVSQSRKMGNVTMVFYEREDNE